MGAGAPSPKRKSYEAIRVERVVERVYNQREQAVEVLPLSDLLHDPESVILLGDPGMGKTTALRDAAMALPGSIYRQVRSFTSSTTVQVPAGSTLLLDALDEATAAGASDPLGAIAGRLQDIGLPRFWLSCRAVDWVGQGGAALLRDCAPAGLAVARLLPLNDQQIAELARSRGLIGDDLLEAMSKAGLVPLLRNPWTLNLVFEIAEEGLPTSRHELFERAAEVLTRERGDRPGRGQIAPPEVLDAAGAICAALLLSGTNAITTGTDASIAPSIATFSPIAPTDAVNIALQTRLFAAIGEDLWEPQHRTLAEFLGARFLADRVSRYSLPLRRMIVLMCGSARAPQPSLRGLFAWLATLLHAHRSELVGIDPYGVLTYGDPRQLPMPARRALLEALGELAAREPWFRSDGLLWTQVQFAALATHELVPELRKVLAERPPRLHLLTCVLDAIATGDPLPELVLDLRALLTDAGIDVSQRAFALSAFVRASEAEPDAACRLFRHFLEDRSLDPHLNLACDLLVCLYPGRLGMEDLLSFLARYVETDPGHDDRLHIHTRLPELVPAGDEAPLLDRLAACPWATDDRYPRPLSRLDHVHQLARDLAARSVPRLPAVKMHRLASWRPLLGDHETVARRSPALHNALRTRRDLLIPLLLGLSEGLDPALLERAPHMVAWELRWALPASEWPDDAAATLLDAAQVEHVAWNRKRLFAAAVTACCRPNSSHQAVFEQAWEMAQQDADLAPLLQAACISPWQQAQDEWREPLQQAAADREAAKARIERALRQRVAGIRDGTDLQALSWLAVRWFNRVLGPPGIASLPPRERLRQHVSEPVARAAEQGFRALASTGPAPAPADLTGQVLSGKWPRLLAFLAGADLLFSAAEAEEALFSADRATSLLCLALSVPTTTEDSNVVRQDVRPWIGRVVSAQPEACARALRELFMPQLAAGESFPIGLETALAGDALAPIRTTILPDLMRAARNRGAAERLIHAALKAMPQDQVYAIALERLGCLADAMTTDRWPWLHLAWRLDHARHADELRRELDEGDPALLSALADATGDAYGDQDAYPVPLTLVHRELVLRALGPRFPVVPLVSGWVKTPDRHKLGWVASAQLSRLAREPNPAAEAVLANLVDDPSFADRREHVLQSLAQWRRMTDERAWEKPTIEAVVGALHAGPPASAADLVAFAEEHLRGLNETLRRTEDGEWRSFWNTDTHGAHTNAKVENVCRDQLVTLLRGRFEQAGLGLATEVRHAGDDRCDIVARALDCSLPVEVKCDYHQQLWTAWRAQLAEKYAREPKAAGTGIYLVFWFGPDRGGNRSVKTAPDGIRPESAAELEHKLTAMAVESSLQIRVVVLDVAPLKARRSAGKRSRRLASAGTKRAVHRGRTP